MVTLDLDEWLKPEDIGQAARLTFLNAGEKGEMATSDGQGTKPKFEILVQLPNGEKRLWTMNVTSQRAVKGIYGKDTAAWVNKPVDVFTQEMNVRGVPKTAIFAKVPGQAPPSPQEDVVV